MPAPRVKPPNPDHQRLIADLLADAGKAMCPICGERGFWDNRGSKPSETSPDFKCRNKSCVGATPMKRKSPYAVWLPDDFTPATPTASKRIPGPASAPPRPEVPADGPPAFFSDVPLPASEDGDSVVPADVLEQATPKEQSYYALALRVAAFQAKVSAAYEAPFDLASINAMTFSIWSSR